MNKKKNIIIFDFYNVLYSFASPSGSGYSYFLFPGISVWLSRNSFGSNLIVDCFNAVLCEDGQRQYLTGIIDGVVKS